MTQLSFLDYLAVEGKSPLHRLSPGLKVMAVGGVLLGVVTLKTPPMLFVLYLILVALFFVARIPLKVFLLTFYPLIFAVLFLFVSSFRLSFVVLLFLKVLCGSTAVVLLLTATSYPSVFQILGKVLPSLLVTALFLTYRSIFILLTALEETQHALYLRGGFCWSHPWRSLNNISNAFGHLIIKGMDASEKMVEAMRIRGFDHRIRREGD